MDQKQAIESLFAEYDRLMPLVVPREIQDSQAAKDLRGLVFRAFTVGISLGKVEGAIKMRLELGIRSQDVLADLKAIAETPTP